MWRVYSCLVYEHDPWLVVLAAVICVFGLAVTMSLAAASLREKRHNRWPWLTGITAGVSVWCTHFVAMLAYQTELPVYFDIAPTILSLVVGIAVITAGFHAAFRYRKHRAMILAAGALVGSGVSALHYVGIAAIELPGSFRLASDLVLASILLSILLGALAFDTAFKSEAIMRQRLGTAGLVAMVVALHFTGMGSIELSLGAVADFDHSGVSRAWLAGVIASFAAILLIAVMVSLLVSRQVSRKLAVEASRFRTLADSAFEALFVHRSGRIVDANQAAVSMVGASDRSMLTGRVLDDLILVPGGVRLFGPDGSTAKAIDLATLRRDDGPSLPVEIRLRKLEEAGDASSGLVAIRDISARIEAEQQISHLALHDMLTDLPNRRLFVELAEKFVGKARRGDEKFAVFVINLDGFKGVNDLYGHDAGNTLLQHIAKRLTEGVRDSDVVARLGGDQFAILQSSNYQPVDAAVLGTRIVQQVQQPVEMEGTFVYTGASVGIAVFPSDGEDPEALLRNAETAMYRAKADGRGTLRFFEAAMDQELEHRRRLEGRLRHAVKNKEMSVHFQPLVDSETHYPKSFEALVRWTDEELGPVSPAEFIPVAESAGLIIQIGELVMEAACRTAASWPLPINVSVNLSPVQFKRPGLVGLVQRILKNTGLPGSRLELEITESTLIENRDEVLSTLNQLRELGVKIAMDDFGTGYSSLGYLQSFPFDKLKIDRVFVTDVETSDQKASIVRAVVAMGHSLSMRVVAEGVETEAQAALLDRLECDELQGFYFSRPLPEPAVLDFLDPFVKASAAPKS
ncbi:bifunctional diguanylate cyclase/phosphodiesterase [Gimibacter soli]|uniref:EAL domain-containing protein n=1 Tax=Gimibacter soli TaxID=3024400 RepID=A0AAE9XNT8_9PROT|nr:EAL domain-containing protein [Gimibacter soli]WCL53576.1 EAL domain-containing protein [Gimibacter soli]